MKIIKYKKKDTNRYTLYLEDGSVIETYDSVIIQNNLLYKKEITTQLMNKINRDNDYQKIFNACIKYISLRVRSIKEVTDYLNKKKISPEMTNEIIDSLVSKNILNDNLFTECYIKDKLKLTNWGKFKIQNNLKELGISNDLIDRYDYLFETNIEKDKIKKIINKMIKANHKDNINLRNKIYTNLMNLGYERDLILEEINNNF